jgi:hypothetical protein
LLTPHVTTTKNLPAEFCGGQAQNCHRNTQIYEDLPKNDKKCALFTKKLQKIAKNTRFSCAFCSPTYQNAQLLSRLP